MNTDTDKDGKNLDELGRPARPTWIEISRSALLNNVGQIRDILDPDVELMAVVKANAYGHGATDVASIIAPRVDRFAVAAVSEAIDLRRSGIEKPILVLGYTPGWLAHDAIRLGVTLTTYDVENARDFDLVAGQMDATLRVHLKVNTGMNRLGVDPGDVSATLTALRSCAHLDVEGIYTHFASADLTDKQQTRTQFAVFAPLLQELARTGLRPRLAHAANSAATITMAQTHLQMVRTGIVLYGLDPDVDATPAPAGCLPVLAWKAQIAQVRDLEAGAGVSYGHEFVASEAMTIAVIPVGYADGFPRMPLHWGTVLIHGREAPIIGRVCMDQSIVDVTGIAAATGPVKIGDEVVLIGRQRDAALSAAEAGRRTGTINYDVTSRILAGPADRCAMTKRFIAIAGNIGVGKSSLTRLLSQELEWAPFFEAVDENPYLADFYDDMRRWSFHSQIFFLGKRLRHHRQLVDHPTSVVQDRSVYEDAEIFARNLYAQGHMDARDYSSYRDLYEALTDFLPPPDLIIYLQASTETLTRRIRRRGRTFEQEIAPDYLQRLNSLYEAWIARFSLCPVLTVPADNLDFVENPQHLALVSRKVKEKLSGKEVISFSDRQSD